MAVNLLSRLHVYEERTGKYLSHFKHYVDDAEVIVDVGCGAVAFSKALACEKRLVIALDIEKRLLKEIKSSYTERMCTDAHHLPLRGGSVDCILSLSLLEHLKDLQKFVEELYRVLKYGGTAIIQLPNPQYPFEPLQLKTPVFLFRDCENSDVTAIEVLDVDELLKELCLYK
jgi:ubiquinone/menaquinone biosynthesis C-methylase UbiE